MRTLLDIAAIVLGVTLAYYFCKTFGLLGILATPTKQKKA